MNPLSGPEPRTPERPSAPLSGRPRGRSRRLLDAGARLRGGLAADLSRLPTPGNLRAAGSGAISVGLERFASKNPLWRFLFSRLPFKGNARKAVQFVCGSTSCCGCSSCSSCGACCVSPPAWIALALVGMILIFAVVFDTRPSFTLPLLCDRGDTSACALLAGSASVRLSVAPEEIPSGAIEGYQRIEETTGIPWFYLLAWEKVASDFGKEDFTAQKAPPPPGDALAAEQAEVFRRIGAATALDESGTDGSGEGEATNPEAERIRIEIERERNRLVEALTSTLRGGSFGYHLITSAEYRTRGRGSDGELRNPWNRFDSGRILGEALLDIYARIAREEGRFIAPIDVQTITPKTAPVINKIIASLIEETKAGSIGEEEAALEKAIQWTHFNFFPAEPHFSPCEGFLAICPTPPSANWTPNWPDEVKEIPKNCPPDEPSNLRCLYERTLKEKPISADERYYICRRLADARANGLLPAAGYRIAQSFPDEGLRDELVGQCEIFITADQSIKATENPGPPGTFADDLAESFIAQISGYYESRTRNPEIVPGEEVKDWKRLKIIMGAIIADPAAWGAENGSFFSIDRSVPLINGAPAGENDAPDEVRRSRVQVSAYAEAVNSYAESIYNAWRDAQAIREGLSTPEQRARDADSDFENGSIASVSTARGIEPIYLAATLAADGLFASESRRRIEPGSDAGGCRPYTSAGSSDGLLGANRAFVVGRAIEVFDIDGAGVPSAYHDRLRTLSENEGIDPLLLAAIMRSASDWDPAFDAADDLGHAGLAGLIRADEGAYLAAFDPPDRTDESQAIAGAARKAARLVGGRGLRLGLAAYWAGAEASGLAGDSFARFPKTARDFADAVIAEFRRLSRLGGEQSSGAGDAGIGTSGIGGCWRFGSGLATLYTPTGGPLTAAMNHCTAGRAGECGSVIVSANGRSVTLVVVDYLDGDQGSADERWIAFGPEARTALGLDAAGPWKVRLRLLDPAGERETPTIGAGSASDCRARSVSGWPRAALLADVEAGIDWVAACLVAADRASDDIPTRLTDPKVPPIVEETPLRRWAQLDAPWEERSDCVSDGKARSEVDPVYPVLTFTAPGWCDYREIILSESRRRILESGALGGGTLYGNAPVSPLGYSWPVADPYITSGWLPRADYPGSIKIVSRGTTYKPHSGIDMRAEQGSGVDLAGRGVYAVADGWLSWTWGSERGTCNGQKAERRAAWLLIYHDEGIVSRYVHLELDPNGNPLLPGNIAARFANSDDAIARALNIPNAGGQHQKAVRVRRGELIGYYWKTLCHLHFETYAGRVTSSGWQKQYGSDPYARYYGSDYEAFPKMNYFDPLELLPRGGGSLGQARAGYEAFWPGGYPPPFNLAAEADRLFPPP
jgi:hypothetical protein